MELSNLLLPSAVRVVGQFTSKKRLFQELGEIAQQAYGIESALAFDGLQEREALGPTGVGHGIALPHARLEDLDRIAGIFIRLEKPLDYDSVDRQPVDLVFGLLAPKDSGVDHLKALALVSRTMRDAAMVAKLRANNDPAKLYEILIESKATQAA
ncbi:PTS sugar transporter subunit IIA [Pseudogemmobacter sonorensis]|uniref:PTS sugar transporter subunit IIA n=1 Tax=Pseudogemmobacter sonorensis TaxID=2989681 RepID=UPI0036C253F6